VKPPETFHLDRFKNPIGIALLVTDTEGALRALDWEDYKPRMQELLRLHYGAVVLADGRAPEPIRDTLARYFKGDLDGLNTIQWRVAGTLFSAPCLDRAADHCRRYHLELRRAGREARCAEGGGAQVGHANGANPISVVLPCHRVIGANGSLTGLWRRP